MARKHVSELLELDDDGNVIGILKSERPAAELIAEARAVGRVMTLRAGAPDVDNQALELMRLEGGKWTEATPEHRERVEAARAAAAEEQSPPEDVQRLHELAAKATRTDSERDELLSLLCARLGVL